MRQILGILCALLLCVNLSGCESGALTPDSAVSTDVQGTGQKEETEKSSRGDAAAENTQSTPQGIKVESAGQRAEPPVQPVTPAQPTTPVQPENPGKGDTQSNKTEAVEETPKIKSADELVKKVIEVINSKDDDGLLQFCDPEIVPSQGLAAVSTAIDYYSIYFGRGKITGFEAMGTAEGIKYKNSEPVSIYRLLGENGIHKDVRVVNYKGQKYILADGFISYARYAKDYAERYVKAITVKNVPELSTLIYHDETGKKYPESLTLQTLEKYGSNFDDTPLACWFTGQMEKENGEGAFVFVITGKKNGILQEHEIKIVYGDGQVALRDEWAPEEAAVPDESGKQREVTLEDRKQVEELINSYFAAWKSRDYSKQWELLSTKFKSNYENFEAFKSQWEQSGIELTELSALKGYIPPRKENNFMAEDAPQGVPTVCFEVRFRLKLAQGDPIWQEGTNTRFIGVEKEADGKWKINAFATSP